VIAIEPGRLDAVSNAALKAGVVLTIVGTAGGEAITLVGEPPVPLAALREAHEGWMPAYMAGRTGPSAAG
jgi:phosphoribosylformylglycinamidine synthase